MALEGTLKEFGLADIFQLIYLQKKTGTLTIRWEKKKASVSFEDGMIVSAESSEKLGPAKIGEILLKAEKITKEQLKDALKRQKEREEKLGLILEELGLIKKEDLQKALKLQVKEAIFQLFLLKEGEYIFEQLDVEYDKDYLSPVSTEFILMEGIRRIDEWPFVEKMIPGLDIIFEKNPNKRLDVPEEKILQGGRGEEGKNGRQEEREGGLNREEISIYNLVDGNRDVASIIAIGQMGDFEACKALSNLLMGGYIKRAEAGPEEVKERRLPSLIKNIKEINSRHLGLIDILIFLAGFMILMIALLGITPEPIGLHLTDKIIYPHITRNRIERIRDAMMVYRLNKGVFPNRTRELMEAGYIGTMEIKDGWGEEIGFKKDDGRLIVISKGDDRKEGTEDDIK